MDSRAPEARRPRIGSGGRWLALALVALAGAAAAEPPDARPPVDESRLWVLQLRLGGRVLLDGLLAIDDEGEMLLPVDALADAFDLAIEVDPERGVAEGWLIRPRRTFTLDPAAGEVRIEGSARPTGGARILPWSGDLYVDAASLSAWWPVDLVVDRRALRIESLARETLPVERRLARERLHAKLGLRRAEDAGASGVQREHAWWGLPALDLNLSSRVLRPALGGSHEHESHYDIATAGDLLRLRTEFLWTGVAGEHSRLRARAGRRDVDGRIGGPLGAREVTLGDVITPSLSLLSQARGGRGFQISNFPLDYYTELGRLTLEGDLRPGWDVELFRDGVLLDFRNADPELRYRFEDVPTVPGLNLFRLVFHGPRGETREEERRVWMDGGLAPAGETRYRLTLNQHDEDLLRIGDIGGEEALRGEPRGIAEIEHGFGESFTLALAGASLPLVEGQQHYASLGARGQLAGSLLRVDLLGGHEGGVAAGGGWQTRLAGVSLGLSHHEYRDFLSERTRSLGGLRLLGRSEAHLDGQVADFVQPFHYRLAVGRSRLDGGRADSDGLLRLSTWLRPVWFTHNLRAQLDRGDGTDTQQIDGELLGSYRHGPLGLRGRLAYAARPGALTSASLLGDWTPLPLTSTRLGLTHTFRERTSLFLGLSRRVGALVLSANVEVDEEGLAQAGVGVSFGFTPDPFTTRPRAQAPGATRSGAIGARAFLDRDADGIFDETDLPLPEVGFVARGARNDRTGEDGSVLLTDLPVDQGLSVGLDAGTLEDPHWISPREDERVVLRPGAPMRLDFPVVPVGEIDGFVWRRSGDGRGPLPGIAVQLLDEAGAVVRTTRSEIDGFFLFNEIIAGSYRLRVDPDQAERLGLLAPPEREVAITGAGSVVGDLALELREPQTRHPGAARMGPGGLQPDAMPDRD